MTIASRAVLDQLRAVVGSAGHLETPEDLAPYLTEWRGLYQGSTPLMLMPASTAEVAAIIRLCAAHQISLVPQGGNTGLVGGAIPRTTAARTEILLSARRLTAIRSVDADNFSLTAEAGCTLASLQAAAEGAKRLFPLSLASEGSCQLGGAISTNAGGTAVLRFGTMRDLVLGLEVVLPDGRILEGLRSLRKDNTGYDLKQLFIGAEGTLGFITAATCKLFPRPRQILTAWVSVADVTSAVRLLGAAREQLGDQLTAFEFASGATLDLVLRHIPGTRNPLETDSPWHVLLELGCSTPANASDGLLEEFLAGMQEQGIITGGVVAQTGAQRNALWHLRHAMSEAQKHAGASIKHDVSVPIVSLAEFLERATRRVEGAVPGVRPVVFGHLGDGNVHFNLTQPAGADPAAFLGRWEELSRAVHEIAVDLGGSFSAEHGIGILKRDELAHWRGVPVTVMRQIKQALDPLGIMNPGKLLPPDR